MSSVVCLRNISACVIWEKRDSGSFGKQYGGEHVYVRDVDVVIAWGRITAITRRYEGAADNEIDCSNRLVTPGFINIHSHPILEGVLNGVSMEAKSRQLYMSSLYEYIYLLGSPSNIEEERLYSQSRRAAFRLSMSEMLRSGTTTMVDFVVPWDGWEDEVAESGIRANLCASFRDAWWSTANGHSVDYHWDLARGEAAFEEAIRGVKRIRKLNNPLMDAMLGPAQVDTCTRETLHRTRDVAKEYGLRVHTHISQSVLEVQEMFRRHGMTPVQWLQTEGVLSDNVILAHAIFVDSHSWIRTVDQRDIRRMVDCEVHVAHCPTQFARGGVLLEGLGDYHRAGINVAIGTDSYPHSMLREAQHALLLGKVSAEDVLGVTAAEVFHMATVGGAKALGRSDLGRLAVGGPADLCIIDLDRTDMGLGYDPVKSLMFTATDDVVRHVIVNGRIVYDRANADEIGRLRDLKLLAEYQRQKLGRVKDVDWAGREAAILYPMALSTVALDD